MCRFTHNLSVAIAVVGITLVSSAAFAHGFGGGGGGGHSMGGGGHAMTARSFTPNSNHSGPNHQTFARILPGHNPPGNPPGWHPRPPYHMWYPVRFWIGGRYDVVDDVVETGIDVEFTSIRQLDAGDPATNQAPAYRVWFHNNSDVDINQPFDVAILGSNDLALSENLPYAAVRVDGMAAGETRSVDIRLPIEAMTMGTADGGTAPYKYVHAIVDSQNELVETNKANNIAVFLKKDIPMLGQ